MKASTYTRKQENRVMKKQIKKLTLAKETLRNLEEKETLVAFGGISGSVCGNPTCKQDCGPTALC
jgi:hypothetical protein